MNFNWFKNAEKAPPKEQRGDIEPRITKMAIIDHWKQAQDVMEKPTNPDSAITVISHFGQMISFFRFSRSNPLSWSQCKEFWTTNRCSDQAIKYIYELGSQRCDKDDQKLVDTLLSLLELANDEGQLFGLIFSQSSESNGTNCLTDGNWEGIFTLATLLLDLSVSVDRQTNTIAQKSFILLIQLANKYPEFEDTITEKTCQEIANMTISGLCASFAQLPTFQSATTEQLLPFIKQLHFVNAIVESTTSLLAVTISNCFKKSFLQAVLLPALTQNLHEEIAIATNYLQLVCENIAHQLLIETITTFALSDMWSLLLSRMNHENAQVTVSTLSLLNVLLSFHCEDFWYETILRYLIFQHHLMVSQRNRRLPDVNPQEAAIRFISFIPVSVTTVLGPEAISLIYSQYVNNEFHRWSENDGITYPNSRQRQRIVYNLALHNDHCICNGNNLDQNECNSCTTFDPLSQNGNAPTKFYAKCKNNLVYPKWKFRYDGTEKASSLNIKSTDQSSTCNKCLRTTNSKKDEESISLEQTVEEGKDVASAGRDVSSFVTISLQNNAGGINNDENKFPSKMSEDSNHVELGQDSLELAESDPIPTSEISQQPHNDCVNHNCKPGGMECKSPFEKDTLFGPFLDILLDHLGNFTSLDTEVILILTELISTLAASRIPLITSLFLDHSLTLQPSVRSFLLILNRIRLELDKEIKSHHSIITEVEHQLLKDVSNEQNTFNNVSSLKEFEPLSLFGEGLADNLRNRINANALVAAVSTVFQRKPAPVRNSQEYSQTDTMPYNNQNNVNHGLDRYRFLGRPYSANDLRQVQAQDLSLPTMATRAILYTHWLLELSAISTELCWLR